MKPFPPKAPRLRTSVHVRTSFLFHANHEDVRKYAAEQGITEEGAIGEGLKQKAREFTRRARNLRKGRNL